MKNKKINEKLKNKSIKGLFAILLVAVMMFSLVPLAAITTNTINTDTTDSSETKVTIKAKAATIKITWNGNGGKIGTKKTKVNTIKKGSKIGKLLATPKRTGYTFKGWYTKKTGGTKITKNTKVSKKVTYYARWTKGASNSGGTTRFLTAEERKLVGTYGYTNLVSGFLSTWSDGNYDYQLWNKGAGTISTVKFKSDGTYESYSLYISQDRLYICTGNWKISQNGRYILTNYAEEVRTSSGDKWYNNYPPNEDHGMPYSFTTQDGKQGIIIGATKFYEKT